MTQKHAVLGNLQPGLDPFLSVACRTTVSGFGTRSVIRRFRPSLVLV